MLAIFLVGFSYATGSGFFFLGCGLPRPIIAASEFLKSSFFGGSEFALVIFEIFGPSSSFLSLPYSFDYGRKATTFSIDDDRFASSLF